MFVKNRKNGCAAVAGFYFNCSVMPVGDADNVSINNFIVNTKNPGYIFCNSTKKPLPKGGKVLKKSSCYLKRLFSIVIGFPSSEADVDHAALAILPFVSSLLLRPELR
jgi:hypothetical protein